ncbi:hypothetical protein G9A89_011627 [Geosiphon pyriformis]|nr:hypothetical protein G9A89_011627 [Geosiphon pyriformis]
MPSTPLIKFKEEKAKPTWETYQVLRNKKKNLPEKPPLMLGPTTTKHQMKTTGCEPITIASSAIGNNMATQKNKASGTMNHVSLAANNYLMKECETTFLVEEECVTLRANTQSSSATGKILEIKNNPPEPTDIVLVLNLDAFIDLENSPEEFYEHYQNLAPMRKKQEQYLEEINT